MAEKHKILVCGDVEGRFNALFNRVESINKKSGPFDLLLCVGNFFGINNKEFEPYKSGGKKVLVPTYILGPNKPEHLNFYDSDYEICHNVYYLGKRGVFTSIGGLRIAYLSGLGSDTEINNDCYYTSKDVSELYEVCVRGNPSYRGVDVLVTSQWPSNVHETKSLTSGSNLVAWLVLKIKPRYHFCGFEGSYYEKPPFRIPNEGQDSLEIVTRFLALARVGNEQKEKWLFALSLTPIDKMKLGELLQKTTDEVACPFSLDELEGKIFKKKRKTVGSNQYFYDTNTAAAEEIFGGKKGKRQKVVFDQSKCWFCLASPSVEKHLIITVGTSAYLALAKGGMVEEHFLICPVEHYQSSIVQPQDVIEEISQFKDAITKFYARSGNVPVFFERNYKTSHMQLQSVPIPKKAIRELKEIFVEEADGNGFKLEELDAHNRLDQVIQTNVPYFCVELPDGGTLYTKIQASAQFPLNFGREVLATGPILNMAERADWRECVLKKEEEEAVVRRIRSDFEPFDFTV